MEGKNRGSADFELDESRFWMNTPLNLLVKSPLPRMDGVSYGESDMVASL